MAFDTFDEGINPGGIRSKNEIKILICYLFNSVKENLSKEIIIEAIQQQGLANYFETSSAFDSLVSNGNLKSADSDALYSLTENGKMIAQQLETAISLTVREKAYDCATKLLAQKKTEKENCVEIEKLENGFNVVCKISGGDIELMSFKLYVPSMEQALMIRKNFYENPSSVYKVMLCLLSNDKESVGETLEELYLGH